MRNAFVLSMMMAVACAAAPQRAAAQAPPPASQTAAAQPRTTTDFYFIDTEGGQATLIVSPTGESLLVDTGFPVNGRDADRIAAAAKQAGVSRIDYLVITHYHLDHVGGVPNLAAKLPIVTFVDHGDTVEHDVQGDKMYGDYVALRAKGKHILAKPGEVIPIKTLDVRIVAAGGEPLTGALPGAGQPKPNPLCAAFTPRDPDPGENARSVGFVLAFNRFRFVDLGDLTWNKERDLVCPDNPIGPVDLLLTTHHGSDKSNAPVIVHALKPRVAVMNNGAKKGGSPEAWQTIHSSPGLEDLWQLHFATDGGEDHNVAPAFIANLDENTSFNILVSASSDGSFTVTNPRTGTTKRYAARP
jgi:beta-lactamase superfamily II metal-dependent hydrolase